MDSLRVAAPKGIFNRSLTSRLKPYIGGTSIQARNVHIPAGRFCIQVSIADRIGRDTTETCLLDVSTAA